MTDAEIALGILVILLILVMVILLRYHFDSIKRQTKLADYGYAEIARLTRKLEREYGTRFDWIKRQSNTEAELRTELAKWKLVVRDSQAALEVEREKNRFKPKDEIAELEDIIAKAGDNHTAALVTVAMNRLRQAKMLYTQETDRLIKEHGAEVANLDIVVLGLKSDISKLEVMIQTKDGKILELTDELADQDQTIGSLKQDLETREFDVSELSSTIQSRNKQIAKLQKSLDWRGSELAEQLRITEEQTLKIQVLEEQSRIVSTSLSRLADVSVMLEDDEQDRILAEIIYSAKHIGAMELVFLAFDLWVWIKSAAGRSAELRKIAKELPDSDRTTERARLWKLIFEENEVNPNGQD